MKKLTGNAVIRPTIAGVFEGQPMLSAANARKLGGERGPRGSWVFPDGSRLLLVTNTWRALAPDPPKRQRAKR